VDAGRRLHEMENEIAVLVVGVVDSATIRSRVSSVKTPRSPAATTIDVSVDAWTSAGC
jgi:hypothetical protein